MNIAKYTLYIFVIAQPALLFTIETIIDHSDLSDYIVLYKTSTKARNDIFMCSLLMLLQENGDPAEMHETQEFVHFFVRPTRIQKTNNMMKIYGYYR